MRTLLARGPARTLHAVDRRPLVAVGQAVDGSTLGGAITLDANGNPIAVHVGPTTPSYATPLLYVGGNQFPQAVGVATLLGGVAGFLFGGPLWGLGALLAGNVAGRVGAKYACSASDGTKPTGCDQAAAWGVASV